MKYTNRYCVLLSFLFLLLSYQTFPQSATLTKQKYYLESIEPKFENISVKDGLPENSVISILQDHYGFMWFGTQNGLVRYDGYKMKVYPHIPNDSLSLSESRVSALYEDKFGSLWIGTLNGLNYFDRATEKFKRIKIPYDSSKNTSNVITSIYEDKRENFWIGTKSGLYLLNRKTGDFKSIYFKDRIYSQDVHNYLSDLLDNKLRIQGILNVGNSENIQKSFNIKQKTPVLIVMMGEDGNDYGYLKDSRDKTIFSYDYNNSAHAGGLKENREQIMIDTLAEGSYTLHYKSDKYYSYQDGFTNQSKYYHAHLGKGPSHPEYWGIQIFDISNDVDKVKKMIEKQETIFNDAEVFSIIEEQKTEKLYIGTFCQGLWELDNKKESIIKTNTLFDNITANDAGSFHSLFNAKNGSIWIASSKGLLNFNPSLNKIKYYVLPPISKEISQKAVSTIVEDNYGVLWIGSFSSGMYYLDSKSQQISRIDSVAYPPKYRFYQVLSSCVDKSGVLWVGTWTTGLEKWDRNKDKLKCFNINGLAKELGNDLNVLSICEDHKGTIWLGTDNGLVSYDRNRNNYFRYFHDPNNLSSLSNDDIYCLMIDKDDPDILWISTHSGLNKFDIKTKIFKCYKITDQKLSISSLNDIPFIHQGSDGKFWTCTRNGLYLFNKKYGTFSRALLERLNETTRGKNINFAPIFHIYEDKQNILWPYVIGSGLIYINPSDKKWKNLWTFPNGDYYITATAWCEDSKNNLWIGDYTTGIHLYDFKNESSINYSEKAGLINKTIWSLISDDKDNLWIFSELGLTRYNPLTNKSNNFSSKDGLVDAKYIYFDMFYKNSHGEIFICGTNGFNAFYPDSVKDDPTPPNVVLDKVSLFNRPNEKLVYEGFISELNEIILPYNQNDLQLEYVGLHYGEPLENKYRYILDGFDKTWVDAGTNRTATYTNLDPGEYIFRVKAANRDGVWNEAGTSLRIIINPPFWATIWAYLCYALILIGIIYYTWKLQLKRIRVRQEFKMSKFEAQKLHEVDELKSRFFTNISHEFRTPLTLILGPVKQMIEKLNEGKMKDDLSMVHRNANKLLELVNQLLDISKIESGNMKLHTIPMDIIPLLKALVLSFASYADRKRMTLQFNTNEDRIVVYLDKEKIEKIFTNLLSNALKFTPDGGRIEVNVGQNDGYLKVRISDTGIGIAKEKLTKIFDRFFQVDGSHTREREGTGIGLSLTKELIELHKGKIELESEEGKGTTFTVSLPVGKEHLSSDEISKDEAEKFESTLEPYEEIKQTEVREIALENMEKEQRPLLMIVEDNYDVRYYIRDNLKNDYRIVEAIDGEDGWNKSVDQIPDLIISDVMMPKMDGFKLCEKLKTDERTSHIPVILLTAKAAKQDKLEGYETGADEYIMKPFETDELRARIKNLIDQRKRLQEHFKSRGIFDTEQVKVNSIDKKFLQKLSGTITQNISDSSFDLDKLSKILGVSRSALYRKITSLTGEAPGILIRQIRLKRAAELIEQRFGNLSEIALEVGFNNPAYFSEMFKKHYGVTPSQYLLKFSK